MAENNTEKELLISFLTLRKAIGWLGVLLPIVLFFGNHILNFFTDYEKGCDPFKSSISHYFYTRMGEVFTGTLCAVSLFLFTYKGHPKKENEKGFSDRALCTFAAFCALCVVMFPTSSEVAPPCNLRTYFSTPLIGNIHLLMASLFFVSLAWMSYFNFTKSGGTITPQKIKRNKIYRTCAIVMVAGLAFAGIYIWKLEGKLGWFEKFHPVFFFEMTSLIAFGFSWLTKGEFILKDEKNDK